jgi:hypothetical protein
MPALFRGPHIHVRHLRHTKKLFGVVVAAAGRGGRFGVRELCSRFSGAITETNNPSTSAPRPQKRRQSRRTPKSVNSMTLLGSLPLPIPAELLKLCDRLLLVDTRRLRCKTHANPEQPSTTRWPRPTCKVHSHHECDAASEPQGTGLA